MRRLEEAGRIDLKKYTRTRISKRRRKLKDDIAPEIHAKMEEAISDRRYMADRPGRRRWLKDHPRAVEHATDLLLVSAVAHAWSVLEGWSAYGAATRAGAIAISTKWPAIQLMSDSRRKLRPRRRDCTWSGMLLAALANQACRPTCHGEFLSGI